MSITSNLKALIVKIFRMSVDIVLCVSWTITFVSMAMDKGKDFRKAFEVPPYGAWVTVMIFAGMLMSVNDSALLAVMKFSLSDTPTTVALSCIQ